MTYVQVNTDMSVTYVVQNCGSAIVSALVALSRHGLALSQPCEHVCVYM